MRRGEVLRLSRGLAWRCVRRWRRWGLGAGSRAVTVVLVLGDDAADAAECGEAA